MLPTLIKVKHQNRKESHAPMINKSWYFRTILANHTIVMNSQNVSESVVLSSPCRWGSSRSVLLGLQLRRRDCLWRFFELYQIRRISLKKVSIRYCRIWRHNRLFAAGVAAHLKKESGIDVELDSGGRIGELSVWVDEKLVEKKDGFIFPDKNRILDSVKQALCVS